MDSESADFEIYYFLKMKPDNIHMEQELQMIDSS
jgi:hypothetical protein